MAHTNNKIPVFILAGGLGTRLSEETSIKPKPMVEIGEIPILVHIMRWYYQFGFNDFVICGGYKSWEIKNYFLSYPYRFSHLEVDHRDGATRQSVIPRKDSPLENWRVRVVDTGDNAMTGARLARAFDHIQSQDSFSTFALTYGDGLCNVDLASELAFHQQHGHTGTVLTVRPKARFGELQVEGNKATGFAEKPADKHPRVNGGFFFFERSFREFISDNENCILERSPLENLSRAGQLMVYEHNGFWFPIDTLSDKNTAQSLWQSGDAPWRVTQRGN
jgi:glucose-1-phosphate cytidylyltransferase